MSLTEALLEYNQNSRARIPAESLAIMDAATKALVDDHLNEKGIKVGDVIPDVSLNNANYKGIRLYDLLENRSLVISFYRGGWCPYCNIELRALQAALPQLRELGAELVAISPGTPDNSLTTSEKNELSFEVLSDIDNTYAKALGLIFKMPDDLQKTYLSFGIDVESHNGNTDFELPMPATFVVDANKKVTYAFVNEDYTKRADVNEILSALKG